MRANASNPSENPKNRLQTRIYCRRLHIRGSQFVSHGMTSRNSCIIKRSVRSRKQIYNLSINVMVPTKTLQNRNISVFSMNRITGLTSTPDNQSFLNAHCSMRICSKTSFSEYLLNQFRSGCYFSDFFDSIPTTLHDSSNAFKKDIGSQIWHPNIVIDKETKVSSTSLPLVSSSGLRKRQGQKNIVRPQASIHSVRQKPYKKSSHPTTNTYIMSETTVSYSQLLHYRSTHRSTLTTQQHQGTYNMHRKTFKGSANSCLSMASQVSAPRRYCQCKKFMDSTQTSCGSEEDLFLTDHCKQDRHCNINRTNPPRSHVMTDRRCQGHLRFPSVVIAALLLCFVRLSCAEILGPPWPEPVFLPRLLNVTARHGGRALLPCAVHYLGTRQVTWRRLGSHHFLSVGDLAWVKDPNMKLEFRELTPEVSEWNLVIRNVTPADQGTYECKISDKNELFRHIHLKVVGPPLVKKAQRPPVALSGKNYVETGHPIRLFCNVSGPEGLPLKIDWFKDGDSLQYPSPRNAIITNYNLVETNVLVSELFIDRSIASDSGIYICRSTMGIKSKTVTVLFADTSNVKRAETSNVKRAGEIKVESSSYKHRGLGIVQLLAWISFTVFIPSWLFG